MSARPFLGRIGGIEKLTMIDFPNQLSTILFYNGCNLRCPYCYNPVLIVGEPGQAIHCLDAKEVTDYVLLRKGVLDGVVFSGGECTLWGDALITDIEFVKSLGYNVKIDTNGQKPQFVADLLRQGLVDYVALDIKSNKRNERKFRWISDLTYETLRILMKSGVRFETRTTIHPEVTDESDISEMLGELAQFGHTGNHYVQYFFPAPKTLGNVNSKPRFFDLSKVDSHGFDVIERGVERNRKGNGKKTN